MKYRQIDSQLGSRLYFILEETGRKAVAEWKIRHDYGFKCPLHDNVTPNLQTVKKELEQYYV